MRAGCLVSREPFGALDLTKREDGGSQKNYSESRFIEIAGARDTAESTIVSYASSFGSVLTRSQKVFGNQNAKHRRLLVARRCFCRMSCLCVVAVVLVGIAV